MPGTLDYGDQAACAAQAGVPRHIRMKADQLGGSKSHRKILASNMKKDIQMQRHSVVPKESSKDKLVIGYKKPTGRQSEKKLTAVNHVRGTMSKSPTRTFASNMKNNIKLQQHPVVPKDKLAIWSKRPTSKQPQKKTTSLNPVKG
ncbi:hypothetical protein KEM48_013113, partial [Puccinia striiformis f. sp. tritici PST-130]